MADLITPPVFYEQDLTYSLTSNKSSYMKVKLKHTKSLVHKYHNLKTLDFPYKFIQNQAYIYIYIKKNFKNRVIISERGFKFRKIF